MTQRFAFAWFARRHDGALDLARPRFVADGDVVRTVALGRDGGPFVWTMPLGVYDAIAALHRQHGLGDADVLVAETDRGVQVRLTPGQAMRAFRLQAAPAEIAALDIEVAALVATITTDPGPVSLPRPARASRGGRGRSSRAA